MLTLLLRRALTACGAAVGRPLATVLVLTLAASSLMTLPRGGPALGQPATSAPPGGEWLVASDGGVFALGAAPFRGSTGALRLNRPIVGMASTPAGIGYWLVASDGGVFSFGHARFAGSTGALRLNRPIVGMAPSPTGAGYWLVASDGGVFAFGDARFYGSLGRLPLNQPIVGMAASPSGRGYWLVASDGGVFAFGDARYGGSTGGRSLSAPIVGMAADESDGYWLVGADGTVHAFGTARHLGPVAGQAPGRPVVSIVPSRDGYNLIASDGAVFSFGATNFVGTRSGLRPNHPIVGAAEPMLFSPGESILPGTYVERLDGDALQTVSGGVVTIVREGHGDCFCNQRLGFVPRPLPQQGRNLVFEVRMGNTAGVPIEFPGGLVVRFQVTRNGQPWRRVDVRSGSITTLTPGSVASATAQFEPEGDGTYGVEAEVTIVIR